MSQFIAGLVLGLLPSTLLVAALVHDLWRDRGSARCDVCDHSVDTTYRVQGTVVCEDCYAGYW